MDVFTMVVAIVAMTTVGSIVGRWLKVRQLELTQGQNNLASDSSVQRELESLRERVATLERIATDPAVDLKRQIQALETRRAA